MSDASYRPMYMNHIGQKRRGYRGEEVNAFPILGGSCGGISTKQCLGMWDGCSLYLFLIFLSGVTPLGGREKF